MKGATLTHNHPSNSTFSAEDISLLTYRGLEAIRATGTGKTYQLKLLKGTYNRNVFADEYKRAQRKNKSITDKKYDRIKHLQYSDMGKFQSECNKLNKELNELNSQWLKKNSKTYGYKYSVIRRV